MTDDRLYTPDQAERAATTLRAVAGRDDARSTQRIANDLHVELVACAATLTGLERRGLVTYSYLSGRDAVYWVRTRAGENVIRMIDNDRHRGGTDRGVRTEFAQAPNDPTSQEA